MCDHTTDAQQEYIETVSAVSDAPIFPGVCGACPECQSSHGMSLDDSSLWELQLTESADGLRFALVDCATRQYALVEFVDDAARDFLDSWELIDTSDHQSLFGALWEEADYSGAIDDVPDYIRAAIFNEAIADGDIIDEGGFSWSACDCCGSHLGGNRYDAHSVEPDGDIVHWSICEDCLFFLANGDIPELPYD